jgi:hypothetical protein
MRGSSAVSKERVRLLAVFLGLLAALFSTADLAVAAEPGEDTPPEIVAGEVSPSSLSHEGGNVQLRAEIVDDVGVHMVSAQIYGSDGSYQEIQLYEGYENNYFGTLEVPANPSDSPMSYGVEVQAYDTNNAFVSTSIGEVQVEAAPQFDEAPYVSDPQLLPSFLPAAGGTVTISVEAGDNRSISAVFALVALPGGGSTEVPLNGGSFSRYEGTFEVPANAGPLAAEYLIEVAAQDDIGQETRVTAGTVTVEPPALVPSAGRLKVSREVRSFGSVKVGKRAQRHVVVRNLPRRRGEPVEATARIVGSSAYSLPGAPPEGIDFVLAPGEKRAFILQFRPNTGGGQSATLEFVRADGGQPPVTVSLTGLGVATRKSAAR